jgi:hypothetical protein
MSQINIQPVRQQAVTTDQTATQPRNQQQTAAQGSTGTTAGTTPADTVSLSPAATSASTAAGGHVLSEHEASQASVDLRQQLSAQSLSGTARQNQAILSLLRG